MMTRKPDSDGFDFFEGRFLAQQRESCGKGCTKPQPRLYFPVGGITGTGQFFIVKTGHHAAASTFEAIPAAARRSRFVERW